MDRKETDCARESKKSPGPRLIAGLKGVRDTLQSGQPLEERFTIRTIRLELEPPEYQPEEVAAVRSQVRASQSVFAKLLGVSVQAVQAWEQGQNPPSPTARRLLEIIEQNPEPWVHRLQEAATAE